MRQARAHGTVATPLHRRRSPPTGIEGKGSLPAIEQAQLVRYPDMRAEIVAALASLSDVEYQRTHWLNPKSPDSLDQCVHALYDDAAVLPNPEASVGATVREVEVEALRQVDRVFGPLIDELGDVADEVYLADRRWPAIAASAEFALRIMNADRIAGRKLYRLPVVHRIKRLVSRAWTRGAGVE
ncbi:SCO4402 family protein [Microlunatus parietis]|uniref:SCO4402 family protein n=1 Tax=Microlunatus parietis TaxID=682979 RepID=UPI00406BDAEA